MLSKRFRQENPKIKIQTVNFIAKVLILLCLTIPTNLVFAQTENKDELVADFHKILISFRETLDELALKNSTHKQWFKDYQFQLLTANEGVLADSLNEQLNQIWQQIEELEKSTHSGWTYSLSKQLDSYLSERISAREIRSVMDAQKEYVAQIQDDMSALEQDIEQVKQADNLQKEPLVDQTPEVLEVSGGLEQNPIDPYNSIDLKEQDALEASLLYLLAGLETWGSWLDPANETGLLPEAEGRFMMSNTPILQAGSSTIPGGIGVIGFAQPIVISHDGIPQGFTEENSLAEPLAIGYNDTIEDAFQQIPYLDRLGYQYAVEIEGRTVQVYRKPITTELTLLTMLQGIGVPPEAAEIWLEEYAAVVYLPQTIQLAWLITGNPLAGDYQPHIQYVLEGLDLNTLLIPNAKSGEFSLPEAPNNGWIHQDPFWEELQKQPIMRTFTDLLNDASEEIRRSFIVALFFLEPASPIIGAKSNARVVSGGSGGRENLGLRSKPFFWPDKETITPKIPTELEINPTTNISDPDQSRLVAEALQQKQNLIEYWVPGKGSQIIPWSEKHLLNPHMQGAPYFIMSVTALPMFEPKPLTKNTRLASMMAREIASDHLPNNQPVFKVFKGFEKTDRRIFDSQGKQALFTDTTFVWNTQALSNDDFVKLANRFHETRGYPYAAIQFDSGPYMTGSISHMKKFLENRQNYSVEMLRVRSKGNTNFGGGPRGKSNLRSPSPIELNNQPTWLGHTNSIVADMFGWLPQKQNQLFVQSSWRSVAFEKNGAGAEINTSSMVEWKNLPSNEVLLDIRKNLGVHSFLMEVDEGYFLIPTDELEHLLEHADTKPKTHTLLLSVKNQFRQEWINGSVRSIVQSRGLNCESVRVLSAGNVELAYSPQCLIIPKDSGWEIARADTQTQLRIAQEDNQPLAIFHSEGKSPSALPLNALNDVTRETLDNLKISTLVPVYDLENLVDEEKEDGIKIGVMDAIIRSLQFFPNQNTFEILMPERVSEEQRLQYTNTMPADFKLKYVYDKLDVRMPNSEGQITTFYSVRTSAVSAAIVE